MKRYWLFMGDESYPEGGIMDLMGHGDSLEEMILRSEQIKKLRNTADEMWMHIFDCEKKEVIHTSNIYSHELKIDEKE